MSAAFSVDIEAGILGVLGKEHMAPQTESTTRTPRVVETRQGGLARMEASQSARKAKAWGSLLGAAHVEGMRGFGYLLGMARIGCQARSENGC